MEQADRLDPAIQHVNEALERVPAAWQANHPDLPFPEPTPHPAAWHPDPDQAPVTTRQRAEVACLRASSLILQALLVCEQANQLHQVTEELHAFLHRPVEPDDPGHFIRVGRTTSVPRAGRHYR